MGQIEEIKRITVDGVTIYAVTEDHTVYWTFEPVDFEAARGLWRQKKAYKAAGWDFWGDTVFQLNYVDEEHQKAISEFLVRGGVGKKRAKRVANYLISNLRQYEDLEGVKMD